MSIVEENVSVFSLNPNASVVASKGMRAVKLCIKQNPPVLHWRCRLTQADLYDGSKMVAVVCCCYSTSSQRPHVCCPLMNTHTRLTALFPGLPGWAGTGKVKPIWILLKQETVSGSGISWAICKSAPRSRQTSMPAPQYPTTQFFTGWMPFLPPIQQRQSTDTHKQKCNLVKEVWIGCIKPLLLNVKSHK